MADWLASGLGPNWKTNFQSKHFFFEIKITILADKYKNNDDVDDEDDDDKNSSTVLRHKNVKLSVFL